ncbi:hypothetical protein JAAARDRAFT_499496 [Jaapia argillacea MUCL 33604]|uniref:Homeobox domain-containing protein n=1 Tax=Jaapia argillacea MUCL 33604 TaxID=933084 RepID=A0A067PA45_9AGAM|nr:hypothetical protein JAAARDRAFT_499496 [Jaapia argillacea MUCL 33604]
MSGSHPPTPIPNPRSPSNPPPTTSAPPTLSLEPLTPSRHQIHETVAFEHSPSGRTRPPSPPLQSTSQSTLPENLPSPSIGRRATRTRPLEGGSPSPRRSKRMRRNEAEESPEEIREESSSGSSSQGDMADTEMEGGHGEQAEPSTSTTRAPVPKKKRTRTLTTPHQAAVLHALLAQSRFPTTAMREDVGRQIGLSARKVQIWFQNQRQKAKRPRSQGGAPLTRPPQYGPFPNAPPSAGQYSSSSQVGPGYEGLSPIEAGPSSSSRQLAERYDPSRPSGSESFISAGSSSQLSGPGMPGSTAYPSPTSPRTRPLGFHSQHSAEGRILHDMSPYLDQPGAFVEMHAMAPLVTRAPGRRPAGPPPSSFDHSLTLPPLILPPPSSSGSSSLPGTSARYSSSRGGRPPGSAPHPASTYDYPQQLLPSLYSDSPFAHQLPDQPSRYSTTIPPPFTLQPQPMWDPTAFSPLSRPSTSSTSSFPRPSTSSSSAGRLSMSDIYGRLSSRPGTGVPEMRTSRPGTSSSPTHTRSRRYDPVRSSAETHEHPARQPSRPPPRRDTEDDPSHE